MECSRFLVRSFSKFPLLSIGIFCLVWFFDALLVVERQPPEVVLFFSDRHTLIEIFLFRPNFFFLVARFPSYAGFSRADLVRRNRLKYRWVYLLHRVDPLDPPFFLPFFSTPFSLSPHHPNHLSADSCVAGSNSYTKAFFFLSRILFLRPLAFLLFSLSPFLCSGATPSSYAGNRKLEHLAISVFFFFPGRFSGTSTPQKPPFPLFLLEFSVIE